MLPTGHWTIMDIVLRDSSVAHWTLDYYGLCVEGSECCPLDIGLLSGMPVCSKFSDFRNFDILGKK